MTDFQTLVFSMFVNKDSSYEASPFYSHIVFKHFIGENGVTSVNVLRGQILFWLRGFLGNFAFSPLIFN